MTSTAAFAGSATSSRACCAAIEEIESAPCPIAVSLRARRPTRIAVWKRRESSAVSAPAATVAANAPRTCPRISDSPTTIESMPAATA